MTGTPVSLQAGRRSFSEALPGLLFLTGIFLLNFISRVIFAPLLPVVEQELALSHTGSGSFFLFISSGYFCSVFGSGFVSSRISHRATIGLSTVASGVVLCLLPFCSTLTELRIGLFFLGVSAGLYLPSGLASITNTVISSYWARAIAIHELAPNTGFIVAPLVAALFVQWLDWRQCLVMLGLLMLAAGGAYWLKPPWNTGFGVKPDMAVYRRLLGQPSLWLMALLFSLAICSTLGLYAMLPLYLVSERQFDSASASHMVAWSRMASVLMPICGGWLGDRIGNRKVMAAVLLSAGLLTVPIGLLSGGWLVAVVVMQAIVAVCFFPSGFAVLSSVGGGAFAGVAISLCIPIAFVIGGGIMPVVIGVIGDHFSLSLGFVCVGLAICCGGILGMALIGKTNDPVAEQQR